MNVDEEKFQIVIFKKDELYYGIIKELRILESDESIEVLYKKMTATRKKVISDFLGANLGGIFIPETKTKKGRESLIRFVIMMFFLMIPIASLTKPIGTILHRVADMMKGSVSQKIISLNESLICMPVERKEELKRAICQILIEIKPYSQEIAKIWNEEESSLNSQNRTVARDGNTH
jgi:hypothetical protein